MGVQTGIVYRENDYFFTEVKGAGDKLSEEQKGWVASNASMLLLPFKLVKVHRVRTIERKE